MTIKKKWWMIFFVLVSTSIMLGIVRENILAYSEDVEPKKAGAAAYDGSANIKNSPYFAQLDFYNMQSQGSLLLLPKYKTYQQTTEYTCGSAAAFTVVEHFLGKAPDDELAMGKIMGTNQFNGTNTAGMVKYFKHIGWQVASVDSAETPKDPKEFSEFVMNYLKRNVPVIVENVDWGGHWRVIIGYDTMGDEVMGNDVLIMADPYDTADHLQDGYVVVPVEKFFYMWFDAQLFSPGSRKQQWLVAEPPADIAHIKK